MKEFSLEEAKAGKPVCTRDGRPARIVCYDVKGEEIYPMLALVTTDDKEDCASFTKDGKFWADKDNQPKDLMMVGEKHEGYVNLYRSNNMIFTGDLIFDTKEQAENDSENEPEYITTAKIEWEE